MRLKDVRVNDRGYRARIMYWWSRETKDVTVGVTKEGEQVCNKASHGTIGGSQTVQHLASCQGLVRYLQRRHGKRSATVKHNSSRLRVSPYVKLSGRHPITNADCSTHQ